MSAAEIKFDCPECGETLAIDRRAVGHEVACPFCKDPITVPEPPAEIPLEPMALKDEVVEEGASLEELASSRPEISEPEVPAVTAKKKESDSSEQVPAKQAGTEPAKQGGLPPKRRPGEKPRMAADCEASPAQSPVAPPGGRPPIPPPPGAPKPPPVAAAPVQSPQALAAQEGAEAPEGFEEKVRRKRKRRNPDEHRLNPREHPKMVAFDEVVDESSFNKRRGSAPLLHKIGVGFAIFGIFAAIGLGILKHRELNEPSEALGKNVTAPLEIEFEAAKNRLDDFRDAPSLQDKMAYVRIPSTNLPTYPPLRERMNAFYTEFGLQPHYPSLKRMGTTVIERGDLSFLRINMTNKGVPSYLYFEKSAGGYALDWDSFIGYNPIEWSTFLPNIGGDSDRGIFRLIVKPADHYRGRFQDEKRYLCYEITDLDSINIALAYVEKGSPAAESIQARFEELTSRDEQQIHIIGEVKWDERVEGDYLTALEKVLSDSWLVP